MRINLTVISRSSVILTRPRYKMTEIGEIPEEWDLKPFSEILQIRKRKNRVKLEKLYTIPMDLIPENGTYCEYRAIESNEVIPPTYCESGDILLPKITPSVENGKQGIVPNIPSGNAYATSEVYPIVAGNTLTNLFTFYLLKMDLFRKPLINSMAGTTGRQRIPKDSLFNLMFPVPPISEQQKIAEILTTADDAFQKVNEQIALTGQLKNGLMQQLLTKGIGPSKFREPEIGELPEEWMTKPLSEVGQYINGMAFKPSEWREQGIPIVRIENLNDTNASFNYYQGEFDRRFLLENGEILLSWSASLGVYIWNRGRALLNQHIFKVIPNENVAKQFLYWALHKAVENLGHVTHGSTMKHFKKGELEQTLIGLPLLSEQQKIAEILTTADENIQEVSDEISLTEKLKKGLMQTLLTRGIGHTKFKMTEIGEIPEEWEIYPLGEVSDIIVPMRDKPKNFDGNIPWLRIEDLEGKYAIRSKSGQNVSEEIVKKMNLKPYPIGTVLCSCSGKMGICAITKEVLVTNQTFAGIIPKESLYNCYLYYLLSFIRRRLQDIATGTTLSYLSREKFERLLIQLPRLHEQQKIAEILSTVDSKLELLRNKKGKLEILKKGLMNDLLTGKVRVRFN